MHIKCNYYKKLHYLVLKYTEVDFYNYRKHLKENTEQSADVIKY